MDKIKVIQRAKNYMELLSNGIDPLSGEAVNDDSVLSQEKLKKCFEFVSEILGEVVKNNGLVELPSENGGNTVQYVKKKAPFSLDMFHKSNIYVSESPVSPSEFVKRINRVIDFDNMEKLSLTSINKWLLKQGYVVETKVPAMTKKTVRTITPLAQNVGIFQQDVTDEMTGEVCKQVMFSKQTQDYILDNIDTILQ